MDSVERDKRAESGKNERGNIVYLRGMTKKETEKRKKQIKDRSEKKN